MGSHYAILTVPTVYRFRQPRKGTSMNKRLLPVFVFSLFILLILPATSFADAAVVQDSCVVFEGEDGSTLVTIYFTVVNFSLASDLCDLHFTPEPLPVLPNCEMLACTAPTGWTCALKANGGADWVADTAADCIPANSAKGEFSFTLDPGFCCYVVDFTDEAGDVMLTQEECFTLCGKVANKKGTWGELKSKYGRDRLK